MQREKKERKKQDTNNKSKTHVKISEAHNDTNIIINGGRKKQENMHTFTRRRCTNLLLITPKISIKKYINKKTSPPFT